MSRFILYYSIAFFISIAKLSFLKFFLEKSSSLIWHWWMQMDNKFYAINIQNFYSHPTFFCDREILEAISHILKKLNNLPRSRKVLLFNNYVITSLINEHFLCIVDQYMKVEDIESYSNQFLQRVCCGEELFINFWKFWLTTTLNDHRLGIRLLTNLTRLLKTMSRPITKDTTQTTNNDKDNTI